MSCKKPGLPAIASQAFGPQLIPAAAQHLQEEASRAGNCMIWIIAEEHGRFLAFAVTEDGIGSGWLDADSLTALRQNLPAELVRSNIQPAETPGVIEIWIPGP